jgi:hypothetical protein
VGEVLAYTQFKKQLEHSEFFVSKNKPKRMGADAKEVKKVWVMDFAALRKRCDVEGFVREEAEPELPG